MPYKSIWQLFKGSVVGDQKNRGKVLHSPTHPLPTLISDSNIILRPKVAETFLSLYFQGGENSMAPILKSLV